MSPVKSRLVLRSTLILSSHLRTALPGRFFLSAFPYRPQFILWSKVVITNASDLYTNLSPERSCMQRRTSAVTLTLPHHSPWRKQIVWFKLTLLPGSSGGACSDHIISVEGEIRMQIWNPRARARARKEGRKEGFKVKNRRVSIYVNELTMKSRDRTSARVYRHAQNNPKQRYPERNNLLSRSLTQKGQVSVSISGKQPTALHEYQEPLRLFPSRTFSWSGSSKSFSFHPQKNKLCSNSAKN
jgi:hypothetical protein